ncbi:MAG: glutathione S-transferase family protein [Candidatus Binatia bacterium]
MSDTITFFHNPMSRGRIVHWMLEEVGAPYETKVLSFDKGETKTPEFLALNPMGKIPTIVHRGVVVTEAAAICAYLADAFSAAGLAPRVDDPARGTYLRWLFFGAGCVEPALIDKMFARPAVDRPGALGYGSYETTLAALEKAVAPGWILGSQFSAADVYIGSQINWGLMTKGLEARPAFLEYAERCGERPALKRVIAADA